MTRLAEAGCDTALISAVTVHNPRSVEEIIRRYLVRTRAQAALVFDRRLAAESGTAPGSDAQTR